MYITETLVFNSEEKEVDIEFDVDESDDESICINIDDKFSKEEVKQIIAILTKIIK